MKKVPGILLLFVMAFIASSAVPAKKDKINWISLKELQLAYKQQAKPIIIDVYTSWCGWCKVMDKDTYGNDNVAAYINANYYAVKFDAESTEPVELGGKKYIFNPTNRVNDLATYLLYGQLSYPTTVLLSTVDAQPAPIAGFLKPSELEAPLKYFGDGNYKKEDFSVFMKSFTVSW
jgi:uncharacterized protein YyaL (SSP411 family)